MISSDDAERAVDWLRNNATQIGEARATRVYLEQWVKTVKARVMVEQIGLSNAAAEAVALASESYSQALEAYRDAVREDERLRFLATAAEAKLEFWRSQEATRRAEGKAYN